MPYLYAMGAILCWASLPAAIGSGLKGLSVPALLGISFTSAALFLYVKDMLISRSWKIHFPGLKPSLVGVWGIFVYHAVYYKAMEMAPLAEGTILATTWSFWIVVFSSILQFRRVRPAILLTAMAGLVGAGIVIAAGKQISFDPNHLTGYGLALFCGLIWSSFSVALPFLNLKKSPMTAFTMYAAWISLLIWLFYGGMEIPETRTLLSAIYLGCVPLGLSFYFWDKAITTGNVTIIGYLSYLTPPLAVVMVGVIHGEQITMQVVAGMVIIIGSSVAGKIFMDKSK